MGIAAGIIPSLPMKHQIDEQKEFADGAFAISAQFAWGVQVRCSHMFPQTQLHPREVYLLRKSRLPCFGVLAWTLWDHEAKERLTCWFPFFAFLWVLKVPVHWDTSVCTWQFIQRTPMASSQADTLHFESTNIT